MRKKKVLIQTERLTLHNIEEKDEECMLNIFFNEKIKKTYMIPDFDDISEAKNLFRKFIELSNSDEHFVYGFYLNEKLIGFVNDCEIKDDAIELGYVVHPDYQNKGYASEAIKASISELFEIGYKRVLAGHFIENISSQKVMINCGMRKMEKEEDIEYRGIKHHCLYYEITNDSIN